MSPVPSVHQGHISHQFSFDSVSYSLNLKKTTTTTTTPKYVK